MKRYSKEYVNQLAIKYYEMFISCFGLPNALKIHAQLGRLLRVEKNRRKELKDK